MLAALELQKLTAPESVLIRGSPDIERTHAGRIGAPHAGCAGAAGQLGDADAGPGAAAVGPGLSAAAAAAGPDTAGHADAAQLPVRMRHCLQH